MIVAIGSSLWTMFEKNMRKYPHDTAIYSLFLKEICKKPPHSTPKKLHPYYEKNQTTKDVYHSYPQQRKTKKNL